MTDSRTIVTGLLSDDSLRDETPCARPGCREKVARKASGRPALYCSSACRTAAHRLKDRGPVTVEVDFGSASSRGRPPDRSWMVRLRRGQDSVIVAVGLHRHAADRLAEHISELLA